MPETSRPVVVAPSGTFRGIVTRNDVRAFRGIMYARATRFERSVVHSQPGVEVDASEHGPICPQTPGLLETTLGITSANMDENCLTLSVHAPSSATADSQLPVLVWIHGGAYVNGSGSTPWYDGAQLAHRGNVIVVSINYRLGVFGYLGRRNHGTLDQVEALRWVNTNISSFGGNPQRVTIFGESAGGSGVIALMGIPEADGLFHRVWAMSPSLGQWRSCERADESERDTIRAAGVSSVDQLKSLSVADLLAAQGEVLKNVATSFDAYAPTHGGEGATADLLQSATDSSVPLVLGTTHDENRLFSAFNPEIGNMTTESARKHFSATFGDAADLAYDIYNELRPNHSPGQLITAVQTDQTFRQRAIALAEKRTVRNNPTWMYWFTWPSPAFDGALGSCHALDIPFAFDNLSAPGADVFLGTGADRQGVADVFSSEILRFAEHGHPRWAQYALDSRQTFRIDAVTEDLSDPEPAIRSLWAGRF